MTRKLQAFAFCFLMLSPGWAWALRPLSHTMTLVAGDGTEGFRDGAFQSAFFKNPQGLAISSDGTRLFVADSGNNRIRMIRLDQDNAVSTLTGQSAPGTQDGPLLTAKFNDPRGVVYLPGDRLVINDFGNSLLRLVDMKKETVTTLVGTAPSTLTDGPASQVSTAGIRDMVYLSMADGVCFSQPEQKTVKVLDLKTLHVSSLAVDQDLFPHPAALCLSGTKIYAADRDLPKVFQADWSAGQTPSFSSFTTTDSTVLSLAISGTYLYALQANSQVPLKRLLPDPSPVTFVSAWGDTVPDPAKYLPTFLNLNPGDTIGFVSDPANEKKLFIVNPGLNIITSFRDRLVFEPWEEMGNSKGLNDYDYPTPKPAKTFRILLVGDSRSYRVTGHPYTKTVNDGYGYNHQVSISKRLELELNTLAALENAPMNFEVLNLYHPACTAFYCWPTWQVPEAVKNNDIDLVLVMQFTEYREVGVWDYVNYFFGWPLSPEGIPIDERVVSMNEYRLKPAMERIPDGEPRQIYEICKQRKLVTLGSDGNLKFDLNSDILARNLDLQQDLIHLCGKPMDVLNRKLKGMKTSAGEPVRMLLCYSPTGNYKPFADHAEFWKSVSQTYDIPYLNLYDPMKALRLSYYPVSDLHFPEDHFVSEGHLFFGRLLAHELIHDGYIPWSKPEPPAKDAFFH